MSHRWPSRLRVASRLRSFGEDSEDVREGLRLLDGWCADALHAAEVTDGADEADGVDAAALLVESPAFAESVDELRREWLRLFVGLGTPEASCLESFYVEPNSHMFGKNVIAVRAAYRRHGLEIERLHREPDDHLGLMLGFLSRLVAEEREAAEAGRRAAGRRACRRAGRVSDRARPSLAGPLALCCREARAHRLLSRCRNIRFRLGCLLCSLSFMIFDIIFQRKL